MVDIPSSVKILLFANWAFVSTAYVTGSVKSGTGESLNQPKDGSSQHSLKPMPRSSSMFKFKIPFFSFETGNSDGDDTDLEFVENSSKASSKTDKSPDNSEMKSSEAEDPTAREPEANSSDGNDSSSSEPKAKSSDIEDLSTSEPMAKSSDIKKSTKDTEEKSDTTKKSSSSKTQDNDVSEEEI